MGKRRISELRATELKQDLKRLRAQIQIAQEEHGAAAIEEGGLFKNTASSCISLDIARWVRQAEDIEITLQEAEIVKINLDSHESTVDVGDVVSVQVSYDGEEPEAMKLQIGATFGLSDIIGISLESPMGKALYGKTVGERFTYGGKGRQKTADGTILGIVKAKDLVQTTIDASDKTYTKKHS